MIKPTFEDLKLARQMRDLCDEIEQANELAEIDEDEYEDLMTRKQSLLNKYYQKFGSNVFPLGRRN
jgi:hypothetical protein